MTTLTVDAGWSSDVNASGTKFVNDGGDWVGNDGTGTLRVAIKFDITSLPATATVTKVELKVMVQNVTGTPTVDIDGYNGTGQGDPETDTGANMYTRCGIAGVYINDTTTLQTTGSKTIDLGATACSDVEAARDAGTVYSVALKESDENTNTYPDLAEYTDATVADRPDLIITYVDSGSTLLLVAVDMANIADMKGMRG